MTFELKEGDTSPFLDATIQDEDGNAIDLTGASVQIRFKIADGHSNPTTAGASIRDASTGKVRYEWQSGDTDAPGVYLAEWVVTTAGGETFTAPGNGYMKFEITDNLA